MDYGYTSSIRPFGRRLIGRRQRRVHVSAGVTAGDLVNISVGQSIDSVTAALGSPVRIVDLGAKKIYSYKDMKVIFMNGKVSDVQ
jgi:hypothetical protein